MKQPENKPPKCKCGHERDEHEMEPPYPCNVQYYSSDGIDGCDCDGYTIPIGGAE